MKISLNWLKNHIEINKTPEEIESILTSTGLEVEHYETVESIKGGLNNLVVGEVIECEKHPNADKLKITKVNIGTPNLLNIVCGAPNVQTGQKVIVAPVGTTVHPINGKPFEIKKAEIRGQLSEGMLCAEDEIGLGNSHDGIKVLDSNLNVGTLLSELYNIKSDVVFEIGLTANRGDAASHLGVARELSAVLNIPLKTTYHSVKFEGNKNMVVRVEDHSSCPRYAGVVLSNIQVKESPEWLKELLQSIGINSINNVVDITNYILHDLGQPLHAFDYDKITSNELIIGKGNKGDKFICLDNKTIELTGEELLIKDKNHQGLCLAGVYGGANSGVSSSTHTLFLESAYFKADVVRKTAKYHALNTDSSFRFERGTNPEMVIKALENAINLLQDLAGANVDSQLIDIYPNPILGFDITLRKVKIKQVCGFDIPDANVEQILTGLGISIVSKNENDWHLKVPAFKSDVTREIDVIEELIRIHGFEHVPLHRQMSMALNYNNSLNKRKIQDEISQILIGIGLHEIMTNSLSSDKYYKDNNDLVNIENPLSMELNIMRKTMLYSGLESIAHNKNRKQNKTHFFEFGKVYSYIKGHYVEKEMLAMFVSGNKTNDSWENKSQAVDIYFLKSLVERISQYFNATIKYDLIEVDNETLKKFSIKDKVYFVELDINQLIKQKKSQVFKLKNLPVFPIVKRDLSLVVDKQIKYQDIEKIALNNKQNLIVGINVFDVYEGKPLDDNKKSISLSFDLYDETKTLTDNEIDTVMNSLIESYEREINALIRK